MTRTSWLKKIWKGRSKGVSTVIGTVFLILIIFMVSTNVLLWTFSQNALYTQAEKDVNQDEADRRNENVVATNGNYSVSGNEVTVEATLTNAGAVAAQITSLWVFATPIQTYNYTSLSLNLNPGNVTELTGSNAILITVDEADSADDFVSWFVTARGNTVSVTQVEVNGTIVAQVALGIGAVGMDFSSFVYYNVISVGGGSYGLQEYPNGLEGFTVPKGPDIAFRVILTNYDANKKTINLSSHSMIWMLFPTSASDVAHSGWWYIVNVNGSGTISSAFSNIPMPYGVPTKVYFASSNDGSFSPVGSKRNGPAAVNLMLFGTIGGVTFGQNIPFVSVYFT